MAILNVTPDSFSGDGLSRHSTDDVIAHAMQLVQDGADILDIGGESTRPGAAVVAEKMRFAALYLS
jgi:dihydropteroate synthase